MADEKPSETPPPPPPKPDPLIGNLVVKGGKKGQTKRG